MVKYSKVQTVALTRLVLRIDAGPHLALPRMLHSETDLSWSCDFNQRSSFQTWGCGCHTVELCNLFYVLIYGVFSRQVEQLL